MMSLADTGVSEAAAAVGDKAADAVVSGATAVQSATDAAAAAVQRDNGWFGFFTGPFESILKVGHLPYMEYALLGAAQDRLGLWEGTSTAESACKPTL